MIFRVIYDPFHTQISILNSFPSSSTSLQSLMTLLKFFSFFFSFFFLFSFFLIIIYLFIYLFLTVLGLRLCARASSRGGKRGPLFIAVRGPHYRGLSLRSTGSRRAGSAVVAHGPSCSAACGILPDQGSNPCPLH